uniref:Uncharacterized protein n=1 Tax=Ixodes ricinus TaxID=34613 RepID=A0A147BM29_IXORI
MVSCAVNNCSSRKSRRQRSYGQHHCFSRSPEIIRNQDKATLEQSLGRRCEWLGRIRRHNNLDQAGKDGRRTRPILGANISGPERKNKKKVIKKNRKQKDEGC